MKNQPNPSPEQHFYKFLHQLVQQNQGSDNSGLTVYAISLGFFALVLSLLIPLLFIKISTMELPASSTTITNTQGQ